MNDTTRENGREMKYNYCSKPNVRTMIEAVLVLSADVVAVRLKVAT